MFNNEIIKKIMGEKINKEKIYNNVINNYKKNTTSKIIKYSFGVLIALIISLTFIYKFKNKTFESENVHTFNIEDSKDYIIKDITLKNNDVSKNYSTTSSNNYNFIDSITTFKSLTDLKNMKIYELYIKDDNNLYTILHENNIIFTFDDDRLLKIAFSKEYIPFNDYFSGGDFKIININDIIMKEEDNIFRTAFKYMGYNVFIQSENISKEELINFIRVITE
ncbi:MAG: hypothetical protein IJK67_01820 [Bacilli bacterium]|nr:hypothetical protein [Bacilli bacterium]